MKPKFLTSILLFVSAYSPLFVILAIKDFDFKKLHSFKHPIGVMVLFLVTVISVILLFLTVRKLEKGNMPVTVTSVRNRSSDLINYTIPYILSFFGFDLSKWGDTISLSIFLLIMMFLTIKTKSVFLNPMLALAGYGLYDVEYKFNTREFSVILLSKEDLRKGDVCFVRSLNRFLYIVTQKEDESIVRQKNSN